MKHLGDITKIDGTKIEPVWCVIGGFPLAWEERHGKGTARWASEIEEFPIALTKFHFPETEKGGAEMSREVRIGRLVGFLTDLKSEILLDLNDGGLNMYGGCGCLAAAEHLDDTVNKLVEQQTRIADLEKRLSLSEEQDDLYATAFGEIEDWTEEELESIKVIVKRHEEQL